MKIDKKVLIIFAIAAGVFLIIGGIIFLTQKKDSKETPIALPQKPKKIEIQPKQEENVSLAYSYDSQNLRDPFAPLIIKRDEKKQSTSPFEVYDIEDFKLTGIAKDNKGAYALLQAPDGKFYIIRDNDKIGVSKSRVKILKDSVEVIEGNKVKRIKLYSEEDK